MIRVVSLARANLHLLMYILLIIGLFWCLSNEKTYDEEETIHDNTSKNNDSIRDTTIGEKLKEIMEKLEQSLKYVRII